MICFLGHFLRKTLLFNFYAEKPSSSNPDHIHICDTHINTIAIWEMSNEKLGPLIPDEINLWAV
jgi:hypothetical protein